jgi:alpha-tubulin suppressor-like RCC1 family protein
MRSGVYVVWLALCGCELVAAIDDRDLGPAGSAGQGGGGSGAGGGDCAPLVAEDEVSLARGHAEYHTCAVRNGKLWCWGGNTRGQLGIGSTTGTDHPVEVPLPASVIDATVGHEHTCAALVDGSVWCWGANPFGQLGIGGTADSTVPVLVPGVSDIVEIDAGFDFTCAREASGALWCWGSNGGYEQSAGCGQLGDGSDDPHDVPAPVPGVADATVLVTGSYHTCVVRPLGAVWCWGCNMSGQFGEMGANTGTPTEVESLSGSVALLAAGDAMSCVVFHNQQSRCFGSVPFTDPVAAVQDIDGGRNHFCMRRLDGAYCAGENGSLAQLGDGTMMQPASFVPVARPGTIGDIAVLWDHACARWNDDQQVRCWGRSSEGQLGPGYKTAPEPNGAGTGTAVPVPVCW